MNYETLDDFSSIIDDLLALYYDAIRGFRNNYFIKNSETLGQEGDAIIYPEKSKQIDNSEIETLYANKESYQTTVKNYKERNAYYGKNHSNIGNLIICQLYAYWEDYYRDRIAQDLRIKKSKLSLNIFGDLRHLRHSILHHRAIALDTVEKCKILSWFKKGDEITLYENQIDIIINHVRTTIYFLRNSYKINSPEKYLLIQEFWNKSN